MLKYNIFVMLVLQHYVGNEVLYVSGVVHGLKPLGLLTWIQV
jgi:hypothetical protein